MNSVALNYKVLLTFLSKIRGRLIIKCLRLAPVVRRVDSAIQGITQHVLVIFIRCIALSPSFEQLYVNVISYRTLKQEDCL